MHAQRMTRVAICATCTVSLISYTVTPLCHIIGELLPAVASAVGEALVCIKAVVEGKGEDR